ncbi:MAG: hypothetical protein Q4E13_02130 [Clostridia bacterium]|nr:hypothetical protein [Clostridia bacterium]
MFGNGRGEIKDGRLDNRAAGDGARGLFSDATLRALIVPLVGFSCAGEAAISGVSPVAMINGVLIMAAVLRDPGVKKSVGFE